MTTSTAQKVLVQTDKYVDKHYGCTTTYARIQAPEGSFLSNECLALLLHLAQEYKDGLGPSIAEITTSGARFRWTTHGTGQTTEKCVCLAKKVAQGVEACDQTGWVIPNGDFDAWVDGTPAGKNLKFISEMV